MYNQFGNMNGMQNMTNYGYSYNNINQNQITRVNGENGARAYQLAPNSSVLLLDETAPVVWLAQTDGAGYKTVTPYEIKPLQTTSAQHDVSSLEKRIEKLEAMIYEQSDITSNDKTKHKSYERSESVKE